MNKILAWAGGALAIAVLGAILFGGPVVNWAMNMYRAQVAQTETARDETVTATETTEAERGLAAESSANVDTVNQAVTRTIILREAARAAPDAEEPLPSDSVDRLRAHDDFLCRLRPAICPDRGDVADTGPGGSGQAVRALDPPH